MNKLLDEWINYWINELIIEWTNKVLNEWINFWMNESIIEWMNNY